MQKTLEAVTVFALGFYSGGLTFLMTVCHARTGAITINDLGTMVLWPLEVVDYWLKVVLGS